MSAAIPYLLRLRHFPDIFFIENAVAVRELRGSFAVADMKFLGPHPDKSQKMLKAEGWELHEPELKITNTYCMELSQHNLKQRQKPFILDQTFSEQAGKPGARTLHPAYYQEEVPSTRYCGTKWRRGHYLKRSLDRAIPEKNKPDFIMNKHVVHSERKQPASQ